MTVRRSGGGRPTGAAFGHGRPGMGPPAEKAKHDGATVRRMAARLRPERIRLAVVMVLATISVAFTVAGPKILGTAANILFDGLVSRQLPAGVSMAQAVALLWAHGRGQLAAVLPAMDIAPGAGADFSRPGQVPGLAALAHLLGAVFNWGQGYIMAGIAQRTMYGLRRDAGEKLARLPLGYFDSHPHGDILGRVTNDIGNITTTPQQGLGQLLISVLTITGGCWHDVLDLAGARRGTGGHHPAGHRDHLCHREALADPVRRAVAPDGPGAA